ncbi:MAG: glycosyltransferase family 2 protein [Bifidobacteriaceae bacterium]|jgi:glycosyltransferase involved in cell wall biosynthesis|nr:glycosyltransferase family 2 protein [Bifidobacteriaceae bacterium]
MTASEFDDVWVVVPVFNEAPVLEAVLDGLTAVFPWVCVVDDASDDGSGGIARCFADRGVRLLTHPVNLGQGAALQTGFEYVLGDPSMARVVTFDADGQHVVDDAVRLARRLTAGFDVVLGSRFVARKASPMGWPKRSLLRLAVAYTRVSTRLKVSDTHNGLRALNRQAVGLMNLTQSGMAHATEILERIKQRGLRYTEEPVEIHYSAYSRAKGQPLLNAVNILVDLLVK